MSLVYREMEGVMPEYDFLRHQVGRIVERASLLPRYDANRRLVGIDIGLDRVRVFELLGFGRTVDDAYEMAQKRGGGA